MYIEYKDIKSNDVAIDVRTPEEFNKMPLFEYNVPIINKEQHDYLKSHIYLAIPIVIKGFFENRIAIKERLLSLSENKSKRLIISCSQGRVRSPIIYFYAKSLGLKAKILKGGIKPHFGFKQKNLKNLYGFLEI